MPNNAELKCAYNPISASKLFFQIIKQSLFEHRKDHFHTNIRKETTTKKKAAVVVSFMLKRANLSD